MGELQVFNNKEFGTIRIVKIEGEPWMVGRDVAQSLGYVNTKDALANHVDAEDKQIIQRSESTTLDIPNRGLTIINESGLYSLVLSSKMPNAKKFRRWVTSEVLPSIRKTGGYIAATPEMTEAEIMARAVLVAQDTIKRMDERIKVLQAENAVQKQVIAEFEPIRQYVDTILSSARTLTVTQIAADYGMSAKKLNKILHEEGIQRKVNRQWILYNKYMNHGYTKSRTINIVRKDGTPDTTLHTEWTQKGRLKIHEILTSRGIVAVMDRKK